MPKKNDLEYQEMLALAQWLDFRRIFWMHSPSELMHTIGQRVKMHKIGVRAGVPDVLIFDPPKTVDAVGVAIEMKAPHPHKFRTSAEQKAWLAEIEKRGWLSFVARGAGDAITVLQKLGY
jgi:hypothetical protein